MYDIRIHGSHTSTLGPSPASESRSNQMAYWRKPSRPRALKSQHVVAAIIYLFWRGVELESGSRLCQWRSVISGSVSPSTSFNLVNIPQSHHLGTDRDNKGIMPAIL